MNAAPTSEMAGSPFYGVYQTLDAKFMAVGALEPQFYAEFLRLLDLPLDPNAQFDRNAWPQLRTKISAAFATRPQQEWAKIFSDRDACVAPVLGMADAPGRPQLAARKTFFVGNGITSRPRHPVSRGLRQQWTVHRACLARTRTRCSLTG
jgi:alpha-methylacyl-CoA racemase